MTIETQAPKNRFVPHYIRPDGLLCRSEACPLSTDHDGEGRPVDLIWSPDSTAPPRWVLSAVIAPNPGVGARSGRGEVAA